MHAPRKYDHASRHKFSGWTEMLNYVQIRFSSFFFNQFLCNFHDRLENYDNHPMGVESGLGNHWFWVRLAVVTGHLNGRLVDCKDSFETKMIDTLRIPIYDRRTLNCSVQWFLFNNSMSSKNLTDNLDFSRESRPQNMATSVMLIVSLECSVLLLRKYS